MTKYHAFAPGRFSNQETLRNVVTSTSRDKAKVIFQKKYRALSGGRFFVFTRHEYDMAYAPGGGQKNSYQQYRKKQRGK